MDLKIKYERGLIKPDKNSLILLGIVLLLTILVGIGLFYYLKKEPEITIQEPPEDPMKEIIKSLSGSSPGELISEELQESLSGSSISSSSEEEKQKIIESLTGTK